VSRLRRALLAALVCLIAACGGEDVERAPAVEAREGNEVLLGQVSYRVVTFRELNRDIAPERSLIESVRTEPGHGLYAAFVRACNHGEEPVAPTGAIHLEDAFGESFRPVSEGLEPSLAYAPRRLEPGACVPATGSAADRTFDGAALVFDVPYDSTQERPLILEIRERSEGGERARIVLDL
jgi:hypothetical protein